MQHNTTFCVCSSLCLLLLLLLFTSVHSQTPSSCSVEKDGMIIDLSKADNGTFGWIIQDYIPGSFYNVNLCKAVVPSNRTFCAFGEPSQLLYIDNYFHRCLGIGKPGPKISLFDKNSIQHGLVVEFDLFSSSNDQLLGAKLFVLCDENVEFDGKYIGKSKKFFKEEYVYSFKIFSKHACPRKKQNIPIRGGLLN